MEVTVYNLHLAIGVRYNMEIQSHIVYRSFCVEKSCTFSTAVRKVRDFFYRVLVQNTFCTISTEAPCNTSPWYNNIMPLNALPWGSARNALEPHLRHM